MMAYKTVYHQVYDFTTYCSPFLCSLLHPRHTDLAVPQMCQSWSHSTPISSHHVLLLFPLPDCSSCRSPDSSLPQLLPVFPHMSVSVRHSVSSLPTLQVTIATAIVITLPIPLPCFTFLPSTYHAIYFTYHLPPPN